MTGWYLRAYYDETSYVTSDDFTIELSSPKFTSSPTGGTIYPWTTLKLSWKTNFVPEKIVIGYSSGSSWVTEATLTSDLAKSMNYTLDYDTAVSSANWQIRAYYGTGTSDYVSSSAFTVNKLEAYVCGDNLTAVLGSDGTLTLSGTGAMYDYYYGASSPVIPVPWDNERSSIKKVVIPSGVTYIGQYAFYYCNKLTYVILPPSVTSIGAHAFNSCNALNSVSYDGFPAQWDAIDIDVGNASLKNASRSYLYRSGRIGSSNVWWNLYGSTGRLVISGGDSTIHVTAPWQEWGDYITEIEMQYGEAVWEEAFRDCPNVKIVRLPGDLELVDYEAFRVCTKITDVYYDGTENDWNRITIQPGNDPLLNARLHTEPHHGTLTDDLSWTLDDSGLLRIFYDDENMGSGEETDIPDYSSYTETPWYLEGYAEEITAIRVEDGVTGIGSHAFDRLGEVKTAEIADSVTFIGNYAFQNCWDLETIHIPDSVQRFGYGSFAYCDDLTEFVIPDGVEEIPERCFEDCLSLERLTIPTSVCVIGAWAFAGCDDMMDGYCHVYYIGTSAQWKNIDVDEGNDVLLEDAIIHFNPPELRIDAVNFPDAQFRAYVAENFDTDGSGWLTDEERAAADYISDEDNDYTSLQGIEYFPNLTGILIDAAPSLISVDLTANTKLIYVDFSDDENLAEINLTGLTELISLNVSGTNIEEIDLTGLTSLQSLYASDTPLAALDLNDQSLIDLYVQNTELTELDLSGQTELRRLYCYGTNIVSLDLRNSPELLNTVLNGTQTVTADYVQYRIDSNHLLRVDPDMTPIGPEGICINAANFPDAQFRSYVKRYFDTNGNGWLTDDEIEAATAISMDSFDGFYSVKGIEYLTELTSLELTNDPDLTGVDLSANTKLTYVDFSCSGLTALNVSMLLALEKLWCDNNPLTSLTLGSQQALKTLTCYGTDLTELDISGCPLLLDAYLNGSRTENEDYMEYENGSNTLCVDAGTEIVTEAIDANLKFAARSITLQDNLQVNYKVNRAVIDDGGYTDPYVVFNMNGNEVKVTGTLDIAGTYYVFSFRNIAPHRINDDFTATLYATLDGELHEGVTLSYSISQYCYNQLNKLSSQSEFATLLVDLLNYGAQSQLYTGYNTGNLANAQLTATQASWGTTTEPTYTTVQNTKYETVEDPLVTWTALGLYLEDTVSIRLKLAVADTTGLTIKVRDDNGHTWSYGASALKAMGDEYYFYFSALNADQMRETVYITAYKNGAAVSNTVRYSIESYCYAKQEDTTLKDILSAMMKYGDSAYNYVN